MTLTRQDRDGILARVRDANSGLRPPDSGQSPSGDDYHLLTEQLYTALGEYFDRLPRVPMSACPFCGATLKRAFDPFGFDGPWWHVDLLCEIQEPAHCEHFQVILGAVSLRDREPEEAVEEVQPGPDVPFVVPALLDLPGMVAVIGQLTLETGDRAYPIAYFSDATVDPADLHQPWCRTSFWFKNDEGEALWSISNDLWSFDLEPFLREGRVRWTDLGAGSPRALRATEGHSCPFTGLPGDRRPQKFIRGSRKLLGLPSGEPINPFDA